MTFTVLVFLNLYSTNFRQIFGDFTHSDPHPQCGSGSRRSPHNADPHQCHSKIILRCPVFSYTVHKFSSDIARDPRPRLILHSVLFTLEAVHVQISNLHMQNTVLWAVALEISKTNLLKSVSIFQPFVRILSFAPYT